MERSIILIGATMLLATMTFMSVQVQAMATRMAGMKHAAFRSAVPLAGGALAQQTSDLIAAGADPQNPNPAPAAIGPFPVCPAAAPANYGSLCGDTIRVAVALAGAHGVGGAGAAETLLNDDIAIEANGQHVQGDVAYALTLSLVNPAGVTIDTETATVHLTTYPRDAVNPATNGPYAVFAGMAQRSGALNGRAAESTTTGQCDPTQGGCTSAMDSALVAEGATGAGSSDTRTHLQSKCLNNSAGPGNTCDRTGATPAPVQDSSTFSTQTMNSTNISTNGWNP